MTPTHRRFTDNPKYRAIWSTASVDWTLIAALSYFLATSVWQHWSEARDWFPFFLLAIIIEYLVRRRWNNRLASQAANHNLTTQESVEDRLDELERLKRRQMVTPEEYAAKRQDILKDL